LTLALFLDNITTMNHNESKEEILLKQIISSCELILDDLEMGSSLNQAEFNNLGIVDASMFKLQKSVSATLDNKVQQEVWEYKGK
tara:strand:- start:401 stop:655 length:255 start_codon:yes stop_codon:yes gene_type:complete